MKIKFLNLVLVLTIAFTPLATLSVPVSLTSRKDAEFLGVAAITLLSAIAVGIGGVAALIKLGYIAQPTKNAANSEVQESN